MEKKQELGIRIDYYSDKKPSVYVNTEKGQQVNAVFVIGYGVEGKDFVSSPEIIKTIKALLKKHSLATGTEIGYFLLDLHSKNKKVAWSEYWPFQVDRKLLEKKGIARQLEEKVFDKIEKDFFVPERVVHRAFGFRRWKQLKNRGVKVPWLPGWPFSNSYKEERNALKAGKREKPKKKKGFMRRIFRF